MINNQAYIINHSQPQIKPVSASPICEISEENQPERDKEYAEVNIEAIKNDTNLYTCMTEPHKKERVQELLQLITIGDNLTQGERQKVCNLISSFTDIFALSVSEVKTVEDAVH